MLPSVRLHCSGSGSPVRATLVVALLTADRQDFLTALDPSAVRGLMDIAALVFLMFLLWLAAYGAGPISVDKCLARKSDKPS